MQNVIRIALKWLFFSKKSQKSHKKIPWPLTAVLHPKTLVCDMKVVMFFQSMKAFFQSEVVMFHNYYFIMMSQNILVIGLSNTITAYCTPAIQDEVYNDKASNQGYFC